MATLTVRNLSDDTLSKLRVRAAERGRSMEADAREFLAAVAEGRVEITPARASAPSADAVTQARVEQVQAKIRELFGGKMPTGRVDAFIARRRDEAAAGE